MLWLTKVRLESSKSGQRGSEVNGAFMRMRTKMVKELDTVMSRSLAGTLTLQLASIHQLDPFYTPLEERFERLTRLGRRALESPVVAITAVRENRQWFKSVVGWQISELPLEDGLCGPIIEDGRPRIVADTLADPLFAKKAIVTGAPNFRFYAGHPLRDSSGMTVGTYCVFDTKPRETDEHFAKLLSDLGELAERELLTTDLCNAQGQLIAKLSEARRQAMFDVLTRVWNRRGGMDLLELAVNGADQDKEGFSICLMDIDNFKQINDQYGHPVGDQVLRKIAASIVASVRPHDIVCRYGGEEFLTILRGAGEEHCTEIAERIRINIQTLPIRTREGTVPMTVSIGVAVRSSNDDITAEQLIDHADQALYQSKQRGRDRVSVWPNGTR
jgi:diguanylate cyclase (GGDEF)-like protein